jgi:hypothetical protein
MSVRGTKLAAAVACVFFIIAVSLSPGPGSSLGMPESWFFCTWGVMLGTAVITIRGFFSCKRRRERISVFYILCPLLLILNLFVFLDLGEIVRAILRCEGTI